MRAYQKGNLDILRFRIKASGLSCDVLIHFPVTYQEVAAPTNLSAYIYTLMLRNNIVQPLLGDISPQVIVRVSFTIIKSLHLPVKRSIMPSHKITPIEGNDKVLKQKKATQSLLT